MSHQFTFPVPTDHSTGGWHAAYAEIYEKLFAPLKGSYVRLLEIGTDGGGGLRAYQDYFPHGLIYGCDVSPAPEGIKGHHRIKHFQGDAYTASMLEWWKTYEGGFHIIIDDGPHTLSSQEFFAEHYPHLLTDNGVAIIEDIAEHAHLEHLQRKVHRDFFTAGIDLTHHDKQRYDNRLLLIWRR